MNRKYIKNTPLHIEHLGGKCGTFYNGYFDEYNRWNVEFETDDSLPGKQADDFTRT
jgi:hypothetical protein